MPNQRLTYLFDRFIAGTCTEAEKTELSALVLAGQHEETLQELLDQYWEKAGAEVKMPADRSETILQSILAGEATVICMEQHNRSSRMKWWAVAASILLIVSVSSYFVFFNQSKKQADIVKVIPAKDVAAPDKNKATITLADGQVIYLDSINSGTISTENNVTVIKTADGKIIYKASPNPSEGGGLMSYNTLSNPRGSKVIDMTLSDGSHVWLNAGSSITYPIAFAGNERKVDITGEAYFEASPSNSVPSLAGTSEGGALKPFIVQKGSMEVRVLGTHFNVNAYDDEAAIKVTLLEGSVKVSENQHSLIIKPNQQAIVKNNLPIELNKNVEVEEVMAWKNGRFQFEGAGIEEVMRQVARWYDVEVIYEHKPANQHFRGGISRNVEASKLFKMLATTEAVHFRIEGKKVYVIK